MAVQFATFLTTGVASGEHIIVNFDADGEQGDLFDADDNVVQLDPKKKH